MVLVGLDGEASNSGPKREPGGCGEFSKVQKFGPENDIWRIVLELGTQIPGLGLELNSLIHSALVLALHLPIRPPEVTRAEARGFGYAPSLVPGTRTEDQTYLHI